MKIAFAVLTVGVLLSLSGNALAQAQAITGDWSGESICVGEIGACKDEQVVYHISLIRRTRPRSRLRPIRSSTASPSGWAISISITM